MSNFQFDDRSWYDQRFKAKLDKIEPGLWARLERVPSLSAEAQDVVLRFLLGTGCQATHSRNIILRTGLFCISRDWLLPRIEQSAAVTLDLTDEWEYRRLGEVYELLDADLVRRHSAFGRSSTNPEIREAADDFEFGLARGTSFREDLALPVDEQHPERQQSGQ
ncbi:MAG TPA: hypothetical protein VF120_09340 [Ktedonobacterales bacterium]